MVFFTCNACGQAIKKAQVDKHYQQQCRNCEVLSCMDCGKDFYGDDYKQHTQCISEDQKYGGKGYQVPQNANKGEAKQEQWLKHVREAAGGGNVSNNIKNLLDQIAEYPNIPRKKTKFENFVRNSLKVHNAKTIEQVWNIFSAATAKTAKSTQPMLKENATDAVDSLPNGDSKCNEMESEKEKAEEKKVKEKKKKKKRKHNETEPQTGLDSLVSSEPSKKKVKKMAPEQLSDTSVKKVKKMSKEKVKESSEETSSEKITKKKKKKRSEESLVAQTAEPTNEHSTDKSKKKKKKKKQEVNTDENHISPEIKKKKKKKKRKFDETFPGPDENMQTTLIESSEKVKKNKKKKKKSVGDSDHVSLSEVNGDEYTGKKKKTKSNRKETVSDNEAEQTNNVTPLVDTCISGEDLPKRKKKKKQKESVLTSDMVSKENAPSIQEIKKRKKKSKKEKSNSGLANDSLMKSEEISNLQEDNAFKSVDLENGLSSVKIKKSKKSKEMDPNNNPMSFNTTSPKSISLETKSDSNNLPHKKKKSHKKDKTKELNGTPSAAVVKKVKKMKKVKDEVR